MSNSSLVSYTKLSPNCTKPRNHKIDKITIHHMAGNLSVETCGNVFAPISRQASSNYGIGSDGRVALYVDEKDRSWCSSSSSNDNRAVTIEVANDIIGGNWHVSDKALSRLIELCTDICRRNGINRLNYTGNASGNLTMHKWFKNTNCPGPYLESKFPYIAEQVNARLGGKATPSQTGNNKSIEVIAQEVINGKWGNGDERKNRLTAAGYNYSSVQNKVNELCGGIKINPIKSLDIIAQEVINGMWGNGEDRKKRLAAAGYDYSSVQNCVNNILKGNQTYPSKSVEAIAKEVINGKWGNGEDRKRKLSAAGYDFNAIQRKVNELIK